MRCHAGGDKDGAEVEPDRAQQRRLDEQDVGQREKRGDTDQDLGARGRAVLGEMKPAFEEAIHMLTTGC